MFHEAAGRLVARRTRGAVTWEVFTTDDNRRVMRYRMGPGAWRHHRPWKREHRALARLSGCGFPESLGYTERPLPAGREVVFIRDFVPGEPLLAATDVTAEDLLQLGRMFALIHRHGVVTGDASLAGYVRRPSGVLQFVDFSRARVLRHGSPWFYYCVGGDLNRIRRDTLRGDDECFAIVLGAYHAVAGHAAAWRPVVRLGAAAPRWLQRVGQTLHGWVRRLWVKR